MRQLSDIISPLVRSIARATAQNGLTPEARELAHKMLASELTTANDDAQMEKGRAA